MEITSANEPAEAAETETEMPLQCEARTFFSPRFLFPVMHCFSCYRLTSLPVYAFGNASSGQLGLGITENQLLPVLNLRLSRLKVVMISCGSNHAAALMGTRYLYILSSLAVIT
jgi:hypothetical protein